MLAYIILLIATGLAPCTGMSYVGCYMDSTNRILLTWLSNDNSNTPARCIKLCEDVGYRIAGVQYTAACFCDNKWQRTPQKVDDSECGMSCPGDSSYKCGGAWRMNVYSSTCEAYPCQNGGTCSETSTKYTCKCPFGWTGTNCQTRFSYARCFVEDRFILPRLSDDNSDTLTSCIQRCEDNGSVKNNQTCLLSTNPAGMSYVGCFVEDDLSRRILLPRVSDDKSNTPARCIQRCEDNGYRMAGVAYSVECFCGNNWQRTPEIVDDSECASSCPGDSKYKCGFSWRMNVYSSTCEANPCKNGGTCSENSSEYTCKCPFGWTGTNCQDTCEANLCQNGGTCSENSSDYMCKCPPGWTGTYCQAKTQ
ncbi:neurogenic locus notch homolog protein 1-like isoform X2 [Mya arenaria]|uniref:neurogenic locus notch homolog protein 1-like isoform X2 n=1 Tax=Mya arenaria TaxID=6604 RepID=UPI0022E7C7CA|nr:neurogenic locus notch homolog protein 1-like isoform X2 [Mya arenaria]